MLGCHYEKQSDEVIRNLKNRLPRMFTHPRNDRKLKHGSLAPQHLKKNHFKLTLCRLLLFGMSLPDNPKRT